MEVSLEDKGEDHPSFLVRKYQGDVFLGDCNTVDCQITVAPKEWGESSPRRSLRAEEHTRGNQFTGCLNGM